MKLSEAQKKLMLSSGKKPKYIDRVNWACTYLKQGEILNNPKRGYYSLSEIGNNFIRDNGYEIKLKDLEKSEKYRKFIGMAKDEKISPLATQDSELDIEDSTPEELIDKNFSKLNIKLSEDLLSEILNMDPYQFEILVLELLHKMGYGGRLEDAIIQTPKSGDEGIDGLIKEDPLGLEYVYVQAKRWKDGMVGSPAIQQFIGALASSGARKGVFITSSVFSKSALSVAKRNSNFKVVLIDGDELTKLMIEYNIGVSTQTVYSIKSIDADYFNPS